MKNKAIWLALGLSVSATETSPVVAACTVPNNITNGQVADASKVMGNFTALATCAQQGNLTGDVTTSGGSATTLSNTGVTPGTYSVPTIAVDAKGRIVSAANGSVGGSGGSTAPTVVQTKLAVADQPASDGVAFSASVSPGHVIIALATHWSNNPTIAPGWTQILFTNGATFSGVYGAMKVATTADVGALFAPFYGATNGQGLALFELANASPAAPIAINYIQEQNTATPTLNGASAQANSLVIGIATSDGTTGAPSTIGGATSIGEAQGTTSHSSPVELTAFKKDAVPIGGADVTLTYPTAAVRYGIIMSISPQ